MSTADRRTLDTLRDDLAALRIDRSAAPRERSRRGWLVLLVLVAGGAVAAGTLYRSPLLQPPVVRVAYALKTVDSGGGPVGAPRAALTGSGYVVTESEYISLGVRVSGRIVEYLVKEGDRVAKGQPLVRLDARPFQAEQQRIRAERGVSIANVQLRRKELERLTRLFTSDVSSQAELDLKENQLRVAQAELARAEAELVRIALDIEDTELRSPVNGIVLAKLKEVGEFAAPGGFAGSGELVRLANLDELRAELDVNESDLGKIAFGQDAAVIPDADPNRRYAARVVELAPQVNRQKGTLRVEVRILEPDAWLRPDMSVRIQFLEAPSAEPAKGGGHVMAPAAAVRSDAQGSYAWVVSQGRVRRQPLTARAASPDEMVVDAGLLGGEALIVGDVPALTDGQRVTAEPESAERGPKR
jgi:HlyD family secretion protein